MQDECTPSPVSGSGFGYLLSLWVEYVKFHVFQMFPLFRIEFQSNVAVRSGYEVSSFWIEFQFEFRFPFPCLSLIHI